MQEKRTKRYHDQGTTKGCAVKNGLMELKTNKKFESRLKIH